MVGLRAELKLAHESASRGIVERAEEELETQTTSVNTKLLQVENERQSELVGLFKASCATSCHAVADTLPRRSPKIHREPRLVISRR